MNAWPAEREDAMGPAVTRASSDASVAPSLKNGGDLRETGYLIAVGSRTARFRRKHKSKLLLVLPLLILASIALNVILVVMIYKIANEETPRVCKSKECLRFAANLALSIDDTEKPCFDFYQFVCGNWAKHHPRLDSYMSSDWFGEKQISIYGTIRDFLEEDVPNATQHPKPVQQAKDMYKACMDIKSLNERGIKPVKDILEELGLPLYPTLINVRDNIDYHNYTFDWLEVVIKVKIKLGMDVLIGFDINSDLKNSSMQRLTLGFPETTDPFPSTHEKKRRTNERRGKQHVNLPKLRNHPYEYTKFISNNNTTDETDNMYSRKKEITKTFYANLMKYFVLETENVIDLKLSDTELNEILMETSLIYHDINENIYNLEEDKEVDIPIEDLVDIEGYTVDEIQEHTDSIVENNNGTAMPIWKRYLEGVFEISDVKLNFAKDKVLLTEYDLKYISLMAAYVSKASPAHIELYIWIKVTEVLAVHTPTDMKALFDKAYLDTHYLYNTDVSSPPRSLSCAEAVNDMLGLAVAYGIVDPDFVSVTKPKVQIMLTELKNALAHLVGKSKWMDDNTKLKTYRKIIEMKTLIGYPDWLLKEGKLELFYENVEVDKEQHLENMIIVIQVKIKNALNAFRQTANDLWAIDPTIVNAYHTYRQNTITAPMVILQYPFFDLGLDSLNYGSLGTILGHEITHGFDDVGRLFDKSGNIVPWWMTTTINSYVDRTRCFIKQFSSFHIDEIDADVDGEKTLGENIADSGGVRQAFAALKLHLRKYGPEEQLVGFQQYTSEQLFFLSYGNLWCGANTKENLNNALQDEHSPLKFRAIGSLQNTEDFARVWNCPPNSKMIPEERCVIF